MYGAADIPVLAGRCYVVTGANSGIGAAASRLLAGQGAQVVLACRDKAKAAAAMADIHRQYPHAELDFVPLDLANLDAVREAALLISQRYPRLDGMINNAGIARGQHVFAVNHLGHFALTMQLLPHLCKAGNARVVTVTSLAQRFGSTDWHDSIGNGFAAYCTSKRANLLFAVALQRYCDSRQWPVLSIATHPGAVYTELSRQVVPTLFTLAAPLIRRLLNDVDAGALPLVRALTEPDLPEHMICTPAGFLELVHSARFRPQQVDSQELHAAEALWQVSCELTQLEESICG